MFILHGLLIERPISYFTFKSFWLHQTFKRNGRIKWWLRSNFKLFLNSHYILFSKMSSNMRVEIEDYKSIQNWTIKILWVCLRKVTHSINFTVTIKMGTITCGNLSAIILNNNYLPSPSTHLPFSRLNTWIFGTHSQQICYC